MKDELWDIYDEKKQLTGRTMKRNDWNMKPGDYHLTVLGVVRHTDGRYLITKRVKTKSWAPGWWEVSGGGVSGFNRIESFIDVGIDAQPHFDGGACHELPHASGRGRTFDARFKSAFDHG